MFWKHCLTRSNYSKSKHLSMFSIYIEYLHLDVLHLQDLYAILHLQHSCAYEEIEEKAISMLGTLELAEEESEAINEAYSVLIDPELRAQYNHRRLYR
jgi:hypothetical protein